MAGENYHDHGEILKNDKIKSTNITRLRTQKLQIQEKFYYNF